MGASRVAPQPMRAGPFPRSDRSDRGAGMTSKRTAGPAFHDVKEQPPE